MDTNNIQKINLLAKELKEHGIACSMFEAQEKAEKMIGKIDDKEEKPDEKSMLLEQRYKFMLNSQNQKLTEEIKTIKNTLEAVSNDLINLKRQFNDVKQSAKTINQEKKPEVQQTLVKDKEVKKEVKETPKETAEEEQINPDDVSIEKFFYFGQK